MAHAVEEFLLRVERFLRNSPGPLKLLLHRDTIRHIVHDGDVVCRVLLLIKNRRKVKISPEHAAVLPKGADNSIAFLPTPDRLTQGLQTGLIGILCMKE